MRKEGMLIIEEDGENYEVIDNYRDALWCFYERLPNTWRSGAEVDEDVGESCERARLVDN